jgi:hypothetical protein
MRPERSRDTGRAARVARARLLVKADLYWLGGHPTGEAVPKGLAWVVPPTAGRAARATVVDGSALHRATRALTELELRFADVLDDVLDEPRLWMRGARAAIELLKVAVHGRDARTPARSRPGDGIPDALLASGVFRGDVVARVRSAPPALRPVLDAAAWITLVTPARLGRVVAFVLDHAEAIGALQDGTPPDRVQPAALHLALLAEEEGARRVEPLARLLAVRALHEVPTLGAEYARALSKEPRATSRPNLAPTLGPALATWTSTVLAAEAPGRRRVLALLGALDVGAVAAGWSAWWARMARCERLARSQPESDDDARARAKATRLAETAPRPLNGQSLTGLLAATASWDDATHREALRTLGELPAHDGGAPVRLLFLEHWERLADDARPGALAPLVGAFGRYLVRTRPSGARRLLPWARILDRERRPAWSVPPDATLLDDVPQARWATFYEALARAVEDAAGDPAHIAPALAAIVPLEGDAEHALALARALVPNLGRLRDRTGLRVAFELCGQDAASFGHAVAAMGKLDAETERTYLLRGIEAVRGGGGDDLARSLLLEEGERLVACGRRLAVISLAGGTRDLEAQRTAPVDAPWTSTYPAWIVPSLRRLAESELHAERLARRLLGDEVRSAAAVRRELGHLEGLAEDGGGSDRLRRRIANLRSRLASPRAVAPTLRTHLVAKVERAARRAKLARLEGSLEAAMRTRLATFLGVDPAPSWLFEARTVEQLAPIGSFGAPMRALALRVLRARAGQQPWDLRDDPANRAFLERLRRGGSDPGPWVDGVGTQRVSIAEGKVVDLRLEDDPLETLDMGKHFATCLSPGAMNYFSAFANVADVNKRVLFARDPGGRVVGRCLLALTAAGGLVAFHAYAHDGSLKFGEIVAAFARELAARMRVMVVPQGDVPRLVSPDWYDDGPIDLGGRFPFLQDGAPFRQAIPTLAPAAFAEEATRLFAPLPLGALTLPLLVALPEMDARPELLVPLLPALEAAEGLPLDTVARAVGLLARTPEATAASRALVPRIVAGLRRAGDDEHGWLEGAVQSVVDTCPSDALRLLRATRARRVRSWADEHDHRRLEMAARAYEALRRPRLAASLYRLAAEHAWNQTARKTLKERAEALEAGLVAARRPR